MAAGGSGGDDFMWKIPLRSRVVFLLAVFFIFSPVGLLLASSFEQRRPPEVILAFFVASGLLAVSWAATFTFSRWFAVGIVVFSSALAWLTIETAVARSLRGSIEAVLVVLAVVVGYILFIVFIAGQGRTTLRLMTEMELARNIHQTLVPRIEIDEAGLEVLGVSVASTEMGGDLVDVVRHGDGIELVVADVSGHGVRAGVVMGMIKAALRTQLRQPRPLGELLSELNEVLEQTTSHELYATMVGFRWRFGSPSLDCAFAGHHHATLFRSGTPQAERVHERNMPLGLMDGQTYETRGASVGPGDLLVVYTDGLNETANAADEELGHDPIERTIGSVRERPLVEIQRAVFDLVARHGAQVDDCSLLLARLR